MRCWGGEGERERERERERGNEIQNIMRKEYQLTVAPDSGILEVSAVVLTYGRSETL
jgi:hypothetical protein